MRMALSAVAVLLLAGSAHAEETLIHASIALQTEGKCTTALGFAMDSGTDRGKVRKQVDEKLKAQFPQARNFASADNFKKDRYLGNHAVVVSAGVGTPGCTGRAMGVGFGKDAQEARKDAERLMGKMSPFNDGKVKVEHSKAY